LFSLWLCIRQCTCLVKTELDTTLNSNITLGDLYQGNYAVSMATPRSGQAAGFYTRQMKRQSKSAHFSLKNSKCFSLNVLYENISFYIYSCIFYILLSSLLDFAVLTLLLLFFLFSYLLFFVLDLLSRCGMCVSSQDNIMPDLNL